MSGKVTASYPYNGGTLTVRIDRVNAVIVRPVKGSVVTQWAMEICVPGLHCQLCYPNQAEAEKAAEALEQMIKNSANRPVFVENLV
jgi:hypothetical protein